MMKPALALVTLLIGSVLAQSALGVAPSSRTDCPASHPVKGNINRKGEHIYHLPRGAFYSRTYPERCFKDAIEAAQAGFRASKR